MTTLDEFAFILDWPTFDEKKKRELYSKHACHELAFFIARKDPAFFAAVLQPYLANKKDRTFLDEYLLENDLTRFLEPWRYGRLNTLERLLLGRRLPDQQAAEARALADWLALTPVNRDEDRRRLDTALRGFALAQVTTPAQMTGDASGGATRWAKGGRTGSRRDAPAGRCVAMAKDESRPASSTAHGCDGSMHARRSAVAAAMLADGAVDAPEIRLQLAADRRQGTTVAGSRR